LLVTTTTVSVSRIGKVFVVAAMVAGFGLQAAIASNPHTPGGIEGDGRGAERSRVYVAYHPDRRGPAQRALAASGAEVHYDFPALNAFAVSLPSVAIEGLSKNPAVDYIEADPRRYLQSSTAGPYFETMPHGVPMVQALQVAEGAAANDVMVCVIDTGIDLGHPDLPNTAITGTSDSGGGIWHTDDHGHGTFVTGIVAAVRGNNQGVVGVASKGLIPIHIIKVGGQLIDGRIAFWTYSSTLVAAVNACENAATGKRLVVNMSLGWKESSRTEERGFNEAQKRGVLSVAAAGNHGDTSFLYPASYSSVVSVGAVNRYADHEAFSAQNNQVELVAAGRWVLSTMPRAHTARVSLFSADGTGYEAFQLEIMNGPITPVVGEVNAEIRDCGFGKSTCENVSEKICLIERDDTITVADQVLNCQKGGGAAAVIFNNTRGFVTGAIGGVTDIPSVSLLEPDGRAIRAALSKKAMSGTVFYGVTDYVLAGGTSAATPHVVGVAALLWSHHSACTNTQVRNALGSTALDLGPAGRDNAYGFGLVQAKSALDALGSVCGASGGGGGGSGGGKGGKK
jgi:serine protease